MDSQGYVVSSRTAWAMYQILLLKDKANNTTTPITTKTVSLRGSCLCGASLRDNRTTVGKAKVVAPLPPPYLCTFCLRLFETATQILLSHLCLSALKESCSVSWLWMSHSLETTPAFPALIPASFVSLYWQFRCPLLTSALMFSSYFTLVPDCTDSVKPLTWVFMCSDTLKHAASWTIMTFGCKANLDFSKIKRSLNSNVGY